MGKKPKLRQEPGDRRFNPSVRVDPDRAERDLRPVWSLALLDHAGPFGWSNCASREVANEVATKLGQLETLRWQELRQRGCHEIDVASCSSEARKRLEELKREDFDTLFSLRLTGTNRVIAVKQNHVLALMWWDPYHQVCPSHKKHT